MAAANSSFIFTPEQCRAIANEYDSGLSTVDLSVRWNAGVGVISYAIRRGGGEIRSVASAMKVKYPVREDAFDEPLNEEAAWWVGFLMADGCITIQRNGATYISLSLCVKDVATVERLRSFLGSPNKVAVSNNIALGKTYRRARFSVGSSKLIQSLARYGVVPRKSTTAEAKGGVEHSRHFWRGVVDGDGSVKLYQYRDRTQPWISLIGSRRLVEQFIEFCYLAVPTARAEIRPDKSMWGVKFTGRFAQELARVLYGNCTIALPRKLAVAQQIVNWVSAGQCRRRRGEYRGVYRRTDCNAISWRAIISGGGERINLGHFATAEEAARAYDEAARRHFGGRAVLNFPATG